MKKILFTSAIALSATLLLSVQTFAFEVPNLNAVKNVTSSATSQKDKEKEAALNSFTSLIEQSNKKLTTATKIGDEAIYSIANIFLDKETMEKYNSDKSEENFNEMVKVLNEKLKEKDADFSDEIKNANYISSVTNLQISHNRYENIVNNMSPNFKKVLEGELSIVAAKNQLVESAKLTKNVKAVSLKQGSILNKLKKINEKNSIYVSIPDSEKVTYNKDGVVGSINYQMDTINSSVESAYKELINAFGLKNEIEKIRQEVNNDTNLAQDEKEAVFNKKVSDATAQALKEYSTADAEGKIKELSTQQQAVVAKAATTLIDAGLNYTALAMQCTKLGLQISSKPILAAPLALEVGQLKYTAQVLKNSAVSIKKVSTQVVKIAKANNIKVSASNTKTGAAKKVNPFAK